MNRPINIKVCGLTRWGDMERLGEMGVQFGGMIFYEKSPRFADGKIDSVKVKAYKGIKKVGVFVNAGKEYILQQIDKYGLDLLQLHGDEPPGFSEEMHKYLPVIKAFRIKNESDLKKVRDYTFTSDYFMFDTPGKLYGGNGKVFNWDLLNGSNIKVPFFLSGGIGLSEAEKLKSFSHRNLFAIDINSRFEISTGVKNMNNIKQFICLLNSN